MVDTGVAARGEMPIGYWLHVLAASAPEALPAYPRVPVIENRYGLWSKPAFHFSAGLPHRALRTRAASKPKEKAMSFRLKGLLSALIFTAVLALTQSQPARAGDDGVLRVKSAYPIADTVVRLKRDIADKGIMFFNEIDQ